MPVINSTYQAKHLFKNGHFSTIYSAKLRPVPKLLQHRERLELKDGDFLDMDWSYAISPAKQSKKLAILLHGLEGDAQRVYIKGQGKILVENGWDVTAMNHRGCSGEENRLYCSYNSGRTDDLSELIEHILENQDYQQIALVGFSLGGNLVLKYLGERDDVPSKIVKGVAVSAPLQLDSSLNELIRFKNILYNKVFVRDLRKKYKRKMSHFPEKMNKQDLKKVKTLLDFDNLYTAPAHGFKNAQEYYTKSSSLQFLENIRTPVLILNALNDSFLSQDCYPHAIAKKHKNIYLETPETGGHVGFHLTNKVYYSEKRVLEFIDDRF